MTNINNYISFKFSIKENKSHYLGKTFLKMPSMAALPLGGLAILLLQLDLRVERRDTVKPV